MATHYIEPGTVPIIVGAIYSRWPANSRFSTWSQYRLNQVNDGTQTVKLSSTYSKSIVYISFAELSSRWHLIRRSEKQE